MSPLLAYRAVSTSDGFAPLVPPLQCPWPPSNGFQALSDVDCGIPVESGGPIECLWMAAHRTTLHVSIGVYRLETEMVSWYFKLGTGEITIALLRVSESSSMSYWLALPRRHCVCCMFISSGTHRPFHLVIPRCFHRIWTRASLDIRS